MFLGRNIELDARSLNYQVEPAKVIQPKEWLPSISTLDQGQLGSCTGNAGTYHLSNLYANDLGSIRLSDRRMIYTLEPDNAEMNQRFAVTTYHLATQRDGFRGVYPPSDTGSSGLAVCKALLEKKLITRYVWATSIIGMGSLFQHGGLIVGMPWFNAWFEPDNDGFIDSKDWRRSGTAGGHEIYFEALEAWNESDLNQSIVRFRNSWTETWGDQGCGRLRLSTYRAVMSYCDAKQFRREQ